MSFQPKEASPHHLIFLADPQLIDPHSYPSRPWPLDRLTMIHTDKYLERSYKSLQKALHPDTIIFLGDLFDGGREWKADPINKKDISWAENQRPPKERAYAKMWAQNYGEDFWIREYCRFGEIFYKNVNLGKSEPRPGQRGRKIISSLPGNHDLGLGDKIKLSVRNRFQVYFGEGNRIDIIGNHTFVSVDSVSLSASGSKQDVEEITRPVEDFLATVQASKRKAIARELSYMAGKDSLIRYVHKVEDLVTANFTLSVTDLDPDFAEFPTVLLTHVPLYRKPGTPCGPQREHWPPSSPPLGQFHPVNPDERNAISISKGYQYQNVLSPSDSIRLISSIGNVTSVFSGDDHDYCEVVHPRDLNFAREITVKSISWAMGVRRPGFLLLSMWNPVDLSGRPIHNSHSQSPGSAPNTPLTLQSHLCLLPDQISILIRYVFCAFITAIILICRAAQISCLKFKPFALNSQPYDLPVSRGSFYPEVATGSESSSSSPSSGNFNLAPRTTKHAGILGGNKYISSDQYIHDASPSATKNIGSYYKKIDYVADLSDWKGHDINKKKIEFFSANYKGGEGKSVVSIALREAWASIWRVTWMAVVVYLCLFWFH